jgi:drug/metabolite transporter (DMT)-like permease
MSSALPPKTASRCHHDGTVAVLLGLLVALSYGAGDFLGGLSSRRLDAVTVVQASQLVGLTGLTVVVLLVPDQVLLGADLLRGAIAGAVGLLGLVLLYRGLSVGAMSIVAPVSAVGAAVLPLAWGLGNGERPSAVALVGVALALVAVALVSSPANDEAVAGRAKEVTLALVAGGAFGVLFILLADTSEDSGLWPVFGARLASATLVTVVLLALRRPVRVPPVGTRALVAGAGVLDVAANGLFVYASRAGLLSLVAVISSLYPAITVVLARVVLDERTDRRQQVGLVAALTGVVLIAV